MRIQDITGEKHADVRVFESIKLVKGTEVIS